MDSKKRINLAEKKQREYLEAVANGEIEPEQTKQEQIEQKEQEIQQKQKDRKIGKLITIALLFLSCWGLIKFEFWRLNKNSEARRELNGAIEDINHFWSEIGDTFRIMYYFYEADELWKILRNPAMRKGIRNTSHDMLIMLYRRNINNDTLQDEIRKPLCGEEIEVKIGKINQIGYSPNEFETYRFRVGDRPIKMVNDYLFSNFAVNRLFIGQRATFVALNGGKKNKFSYEEPSIYEIVVPAQHQSQEQKEIKKILPLYIIDKQSNDRTTTGDNVLCGSVVNFIYKVFDVNGNKIFEPEGFGKVNIGTGLFNLAIENQMTNMKKGDQYKFILTKKNYKPTKMLPENIFINDDIVIVDVVITNVKQ